MPACKPGHHKVLIHDALGQNPKLGPNGSARPHGPAPGWQGALGSRASPVCPGPGAPLWPHPWAFLPSGMSTDTANLHAQESCTTHSPLPFHSWILLSTTPLHGLLPLPRQVSSPKAKGLAAPLRQAICHLHGIPHPHPCGLICRLLAAPCLGEGNGPLLASHSHFPPARSQPYNKASPGDSLFTQPQLPHGPPALCLWHCLFHLLPITTVQWVPSSGTKYSPFPGPLHLPFPLSPSHIMAGSSQVHQSTGPSQVHQSKLHDPWPPSPSIQHPSLFPVIARPTS